jgi:DNA repair protein RecO (recombination protein O)
MTALYKTRGIVLHYLKYGETSIITRILTEEFGVQSYIVNGVRSKKPRFSISFFQPLTLLDLVVYKRKNANLNRISEIDCKSAASTIPLNIYKSGIALFVSEILTKTLKEEMEDRSLFNFIYHAIQVLDQQEQDFENFHLLFLIKLSSNLGFSPISGKEIITQVYQHIDEGIMWEIGCFDQLIQSDFTTTIKLNVRMRRKLLDDLIRYLHIHFENLGTIRSMDVLREVMK